MEIKINGKPLDFTLDKEKTIGDILAALEQWLADSGHRMSELSIDGTIVGASMIEEVFAREINTVKNLDICTDTVADLAISSLTALLDDIKKYESLSFNEKANFYNIWKDSVHAKFIFEHWNDLFVFCGDAFSGGSITSQVLHSITEERLREINKPAQEFANLKSLLNEVCARLVDLPLDIQTGKDKRAAETIQFFSGISEKLIRIFRQLDIQGLLKPADSSAGAEKSIFQLINGFGATARELLQAYERMDIVLVGDLAEYEMSPQLQNLYNVIAENINEPQPGSQSEGSPPGTAGKK